MTSAAYINDASDIGIRLQSAIETASPDTALKILRTTGELVTYLSTPGVRPEAVVLLTTSRAELSGLLAFHHLFRDRKTILILPDDRKQSFAMGCRLYPRYITSVDSSFKDVAAVLEKIRSTRHRHPSHAS